ncbi:hypothetical protein GCM10027419_14110 [Pandoraea terrae]
MRSQWLAVAATDEIRNDGRIDGQEVSLSARRVHNAATVLGDRITVAATDIVTGSVLGSLTGDVTLHAGEQYRQAGS